MAAKDGPRVYSYAELARATHNFERSRELGEGGFGAVYSGRLEDGQEVAVKKLRQEAGPGTAAGLPSADQFEAEVRVVAAYQHPNLLPVIGYCDEPGSAGDVRRSCIVYPLMSCNLEDKLAAGRSVSSALTWQQRIRILTEIFRGVAELHDPTTGNGTLVHRDIKTANVLLDKKMTARLGDFGLVRALPELEGAGAGRTHMTTANLIGTHQYMAPEYLKSGEISPKTDVYGCGIAALELLTGRHSRPDGDGKQDLKKLMEELLDDIHDDGITKENTQRAMQWADKAAGTWPEKVVAELAAIAAACLLDRPRKRIAASNAHMAADPPGALERMEVLLVTCGPAVVPPADQEPEPESGDGFASARKEDITAGGHPHGELDPLQAAASLLTPEQVERDGAPTGTRVFCKQGEGTYVSFRKTHWGKNTHEIDLDKGMTVKIVGFASSGCRVLAPKSTERSTQPAAARDADTDKELQLEIIHGDKTLKSADNKVSMRLLNLTPEVLNLQFYHNGNLNKAEKVPSGGNEGAILTYLGTRWRVSQGTAQPLEFVINRDDIGRRSNPTYQITLGSVVATRVATGAREAVKKVRVHVFVAEELVTAAVQIKPLSSQSATYLDREPRSFATRAGKVLLYTGEIEVPVSRNELRYVYRIQSPHGTVEREWLSYTQTERTCRKFMLPAGGADSAIFDDEILLDRSDSKTPRVKLLQRRYTEWIWDRLLSNELAIDEAVSSLADATHTKTVDAWREHNRGDESAGSLIEATEETLQTVAFEGKTPPSIAAAAVLTRLLHVAQASRRNSTSDKLVKLFTFCLDAWDNDRESVALLSAVCTERLSAALANAINATQRLHTVREEWMFALPLLHSLQAEPSRQYGLAQINVEARITSASFDVVLERLRSLFAFDANLSTSCFVGAPLREASKLVCHLPAPLLALDQWLNQIDRYDRRFDEHKLDETIHVLELLLTMVEGKTAAEMPSVDAFLQHKNLADAIKRDLTRGSKVISLAVQLLGAASQDIARVHACIEHVIPAMADLVRPLLQRRPPRYESPFFDEMAIWQQLMDAKLPGRSLLLWQEKLKRMLTERLAGWDEQELMKLFCLEDTESKITGPTHDCLVDQVTRAVQSLASLGAESLKGFLSYRGEQVARLMSALINQAWINASARAKITGQDVYSYPLLQHALQWDLFPAFFSANMAEIRPQLEREAQTRLTRVSQLVEALPALLATGNITVEALRLLAASRGWKNLIREVLRETTGEAVVGQLEVQLTLRQGDLKEFEKLKEHIRTLDNLCDHPAEAKMADQEVIKRLLQRDISSMPINTLCTRQASVPGQYAFHSTFFEPVTQHIQVDTLELLGICHESLIFQRKWEMTAQSTGALTLNNWEATMWTPLMADWTGFRDEVSTGTILIMTAREQFAAVEDIRVQDELSRLARSASGNTLYDHPWVQQRAAQIVDIRIVDRNVGKGRAILDVARKDCLNLDLSSDPEFAKLRELLEQDIDRRPLSDLSAELVRAFERVEGMSEQQCECVQQVARWPALVAWMRPYQDATEFETFTSLANAWVETPDELALMADVHTVRTRCLRLLYEVNTNSSFALLVESCCDKALEEPSLQDKILNCAQCLERLEELKRKSLDDVEGTSLVQARAIYKTGTLHVVGIDDSKPRVEITYRTLKPTKDTDGKLVYSDGEYGNAKMQDYAYCEDLRSKLMLVSGGDNEEAREAAEAVERFVALLEAGEAIVEVLCRLQKAGCLAHTAERFEYEFIARESVTIARAKRSELAKSYEDWLKRIDDLRARHYALNAFTIVELTALITLSRTEGGAKDDDLNSVLALLKCVSNQAELDDARNFCEAVAIKLPQDMVLAHDVAGDALEMIGVLLTELAARASTRDARGRSDEIFSHLGVLKENQVNCLVGLTAEETLGNIMSIYAPQLPQSEQVLLCAESTTTERVLLLFRRCLSSDRRTFCIADVQNLSYETQVAAVEEFERLRVFSQTAAEPCRFRLLVLAQRDDTHLCNALHHVNKVPKEAFDSETRMSADDCTRFMQRVFSYRSPEKLRSGTIPVDLNPQPVDGTLPSEPEPQPVDGTPPRTTLSLSVFRVCTRAGDGKSHFIKNSPHLQKLQHNRHNIVMTEKVTRDQLVTQLVAIEDKIRRGAYGQGRSNGGEDMQLQQALRRSVIETDTSAAPAEDDGLAWALEASRAESPPTPDEVEPDETLVTKLQEMGFSENACRKAAAKTHNDRDGSVYWLMSHCEDPGFNDPPAPKVSGPSPLSSIASLGTSEPQSEPPLRPEPTADQLQQLMGLGVAPEARAREAFARSQGRLSAAAAYFFDHSDRDDAYWAPRDAALLEPAPLRPSRQQTSIATTLQLDQAVVDMLRQKGQDTGMNWSLNGCKRAALVSQNDGDRAFNWCLDHHSDPDFDSPLTQPNPPASAAPPQQISAIKNRDHQREVSAPPQLFVLDMSPTASGELSHMLFQLLLQSEIRSSDGRVFHRRPEDVFVVEHTLSDRQRIPVLSWLILQQPMSPMESIAAGQVQPPLPESYHHVHSYFVAGGGQAVGARDNDCLTGIIEQMIGLPDPTWAQLTVYVNFLHQFLLQYENNPHCGADAVSWDSKWAGFAAFLVTCLKQGASDFALPSLGVGIAGGDGIDAYVTRRKWEDEDHPYVSFLSSGAFDFFGYHVDKSGNQLDPVTKAVITPNIMPQDLAQVLYGVGQMLGHPRGLLTADYHDKAHWTPESLRAKLYNIMNLELPRDAQGNPIPPDVSTPRGRRMANYLLTGDNIKKILAIMYRFKVGIPVLLCGQTGCGKTALVQYMCDCMAQYGAERMQILKVHGGTTRQEIREAVDAAIILAMENNVNDPRSLKRQRSTNSTLFTVLFFDEVNTCEHQGYIKSLVIDNMLDGEPIDPSLNLRFVCALNPYEKHTQGMIQRLEQAGLGYSVGPGSAREEIGGTPMRHLVYRVQPLPERMRHCVWDFGTLEAGTEDKYIREIVSKKLTAGQFDNSVVTSVFSMCLSRSQLLMREMGDECSFVSLRDIERAVKLFNWFFNHRVLLGLEVATGDPMPPAAAEGFPAAVDPVTSCIILALSVCYYCKLEEQREPYRQQLAQWLQTSPEVTNAPQYQLQGPNAADQVRVTIEKCQKRIGNELKHTLPDAVALNDALCENAFLMVVAIETCTPLFLVGKPGSSKSLAKNAVCDAMHGAASKSNLFKELKQVSAWSYQCSPLSKSEEIEKLFKDAQSFQDSKIGERDDVAFASVVVLDEIGLAEDSEFMPLKVLHSLLEPAENGRSVAFLGISNWALDPAKMNRGIHVNRSTPGLDDLVASARGICRDNANVKSLVTKLAAAYSEVYENQKQSDYADFFGLRDFYTLIKMLSTEEKIDAQILDNVVRRNFDGVDGSDGLVTRCGIFHQHTMLTVEAALAAPIVRADGGKPEWSWLDKTPSGENIWRTYAADQNDLLEAAFARGADNVNIDEVRFVDLKTMHQKRKDNERRQRKVQRRLVLPAGGAPAGVHPASPLELIRASLKEVGVAARYLLVISQTDIASSLGMLQRKAGMMETEAPVVIFGSSFPGDGEYQHLCRNINRVKLCMETGKTVVLLNLRSLYESLYELLNQYYLKLGDKRYVEVGLGVHRVKCRVHDEFRLLVIAAEDEVLQTFPIPLLNRLEKHVLSTSGVLEAEANADANAAVTTVKAWARAFVSSQVGDMNLALRDAFVGYSDDLISAIVLQQLQNGQPSRAELITRTKDKLLQLATPDAVLRVAYSNIAQEESELKEKYFNESPHGRLREYIQVIESPLSTISTHEHPVPTLAKVAKEAQCDIQDAHLLGNYDSETQFEAEVTQFFADESRRLLIVQCTRRDLELLTCAKYIVQSNMISEAHKYVLFIIHLPQKAVAHKYTVAVDGWEPLHMDCILPPDERIPLDVGHLAMTPFRLSEIIAGTAAMLRQEQEQDIEARYRLAISRQDIEEFFEPEPEPESEPHVHGSRASAVSIRMLLKDAVQAALAKLQNPNASPGSVIGLLKFLRSQLMSSGGNDHEARDRFCENLLQRMLLEMMTKKEELMEEGGRLWVKVRAKDVVFVQRSGSFRAALYSHLQTNVTSVFAAVLSALCTNDNMTILVAKWDSVQMRDRWMDLATCGIFSVKAEVELNPDTSAPYIVKSTWKQGHGEAKSAFSWVLFNAVQSLRSKMEQLQGSKTVLKCLRDELSKYSTANIWLSGSSDQLADYTSDFVRQAYAVDSDSLVRMFESLILQTARIENKPREPSLVDFFASTSPVPDPAPLDIPAIHCAAWSLDARLEHLSLMLSPRRGADSKQPKGLGADSGFMEVLLGTIVSLEGVSLPEIDLAILRAVLDWLNPKSDGDGDVNEWFSNLDALRLPLESWIRTCTASVEPAHEAELHHLRLRYDRLRCVHLFMRVTGAATAAQEFHAIILQANPFEATTLDLIKKFLETTIKNSESDRFAGGMECAICGVGSIVQKGIALPCRHVYCADCITKSFEVDDSKACPRCTVKAVGYVICADGDPEVTMAVERVLDLRDRCTQFFLEYVAEFMSSGFPGPIVDALWPIITGQDLSFTNYEQELELQNSPALCAYLLRVLLTLDESAGEDCVQLLLARLDTDGSRDLELLTLVTEALEDMHCQRTAAFCYGSTEHAKELQRLLELAQPLSVWDGKVVDSRWLQAIAAMRVVLKAVAEDLYEQAAGRQSRLQACIQTAGDVVKRCTENDRGAFMHLLKCILQAHGRHALVEVANEASENRAAHPFATMIADVVVADADLPADQFVAQLVAGNAADSYANVVQLCREAVDPQKVRELTEWVTANAQPISRVLLALAVGRVCDEQYALDEAGTAITRTLGEQLLPLISVDGGLSVVFSMISDCLNNAIGPDASPLRYVALPEVKAIPDRQVMQLCLHAAAVAGAGNAMTAPLARMSTHSLGDSYLPTMREDVKDAVMGLMSEGDEGHWYQCPNGHPYYIGNCGKAMVRRPCPACGAPIGGGSHRLLGDNRAMDLSQDTTPKGFALTDELISTPTGERGLSISGVALARVVLLSSMLGAISVGPTASRVQAAANVHVAGAPVGVDDLAAWLVERLRLSLAALAKVTSRNVDDCALLVHVALNRMLQHPTAAPVDQWRTKKGRAEWEQSFEQTVVTPTTGDLDKTLLDAAAQIDTATEANDGYSRRLLHELTETASAEIVKQPLKLGTAPELAPLNNAQLWRYRDRVSVSHFHQRFASAPVEVVAECKALSALFEPRRECMSRIVALSAMCYLPDILQLQRSLIERLEHRISKQDAAEVSLQTKIDELWPGDSEHERSAVDRCVDSFLAAWQKLRLVINDGVDTVLRLDSEVCAEQLTRQHPLHFFMPATTVPGQKTVPGQIGVAIVNCLLNHHNELVLKLKAEGEEPAAISVRSLRTQHLITLDEEVLSPILFANVDRQVFETAYGRGTRVEYNFRGVEAAILHNFVAGKPKVELRNGSEMMTHVRFRNDVHAVHVTASLRENIPQEELPPAVVAAILAELGSESAEESVEESTARTLRALEIAMGFLHNSYGSDPEMLLQNYLSDILMMDEDLGKRMGKSAANQLALKHIVALVQALDQQQAVEEARTGRDTFVSQPMEYKAELSDARTAELREGLGGVNAHKLAPQLRSFILEQLIQAKLELYNPEGPFVMPENDDMEEGLLEVLDVLEEFWGFFRELAVLTKEAVGLWQLVSDAAGGACVGGPGTESNISLGTVASRRDR